MASHSLTRLARNKTLAAWTLAACLPALFLVYSAGVFRLISLDATLAGASAVVALELACSAWILRAAWGRS